MVLKRSSSSKPVKQRSDKTLTKITLSVPKGKDEIHSSSLPSHKKDSPTFERRKLPIHSADIQSPSNARRSQKSSFAMMSSNNEQQANQSNGMEASSLSTAKKAALRSSFAEMNSEVSSQATPQNKPKKMSEFAKNLLQNNSNHVAGLNNFSMMGAGAKKPAEDGMSLRDRMKANFNQGAALEKPNMGEIGLMSPSCSTIGQNRDMGKRRSRITVCNSPYTNQKSKIETKPMEVGKAVDAPSSNAPKGSVHRRTRTNSMELFRALRRADSTETVKFPSM